MKNHFLIAGLVSFLLLGSVSSAQLTDGLVGYWPLDGLDASDASGNGLDGILNGDLDVAADRFGNPGGAMLFPGLADAFVDLGDDPAFNITGAITLAAWVVLDSNNTNNGRIIAKRAGGGSRSWNLNIESAGIPATFQISEDGSISFSVSDFDPLPTDEWVHMVGVFRPSTAIEVYVNGELKEMDDFGIPDQQFSDNGFPVLIGNRNACGNCGWLGAIDDVAVWNRALSPDEILSLFQNGIDGPGVAGDFNGNGELDAGDLELLSQAQKANDVSFDLNGDGATNLDDRLMWVNDLKKTWMGDANLDGSFDSADFVQVFQAGLFETQQMANWPQGDWNGDMLFDSGDFVVAFQGGGFERGPRPAVAAVPEPATALLIVMAGLVTALAFPKPSWRDFPFSGMCVHVCRESSDFADT